MTHLFAFKRAPVNDFDPSLPIRAKRGDDQAFIQLVEHYYPRCLRFARNMLGSEQDAEEAVQDTFVRVHDSFPRFREDARFDPWLFQILANRCRTLMARNRRHRSVIEYGEIPLTASAEHEIGADWAEEVRVVLDTLPVEQREAFLLRHVEDLSYEDISAMTGAGLSALRMRVKRACDALRTRLTEVTESER
ncbi:MAG: RNA polymerase sigma factor [Gemmatimonadetes bacterium]|nr:RNA polymerase sigma factor [Gemmatimonadota bacterium]